MNNTEWTKSPNSTLDYVFDWTDWVNKGDRIESFDVSIESNNNDLKIIQSAKASKKIIVWLKDGRVNSRYRICCAIKTINGRSETRSVPLRITNR